MCKATHIYSYVWLDTMTEPVLHGGSEVAGGLSEIGDDAREARAACAMPEHHVLHPLAVHLCTHTVTHTHQEGEGRLCVCL